MDTVPQIISTKDLSYIADMFEWNYNAYKQINHFIKEVKSEEIQEVLENASNMHYNHLQYLIAILTGEKYELYEEEEDDYEGE